MSNWKETESYQAKSKERLLKIIETKIKTATIGALSAFEDAQFGDLWDGEGEEYEHWYRVWSEVRSKILTNGNNQIRALKKELETHDITWNRYEVKMPVFETEQDFLNYKKGLKDEEK